MSRYRSEVRPEAQSAYYRTKLRIQTGLRSLERFPKVARVAGVTERDPEFNLSVWKQ